MRPFLETRPFQVSDLSHPQVKDFYCGDNRWDKEVAEWIKSPSGSNSVVQDIQQFGCEVWLHWTADGKLVGYSSLGQSNCTWPPKSKRSEVVSYIPFVGVHAQFQGQPEDADRDDQYAYQIIDGLIRYAATKTDRFPVLMGSVDHENKRSLAFLCKYRNFVDIRSPRTDTHRGVTYDRVALVIEDLVVDPVRGWPASRWVPSLVYNLEREAAIKALSYLNKAALPALTRALKDGNNRIREEAVAILKQLESEAARKAGAR